MLRAGNESIETIFAVYERESTLWKNANAFYKSTDWTKMECGFIDWSNMRSYLSETWTRFINTVTKEDITDKVIEESYSDMYFIRLTNKSGRNTKTFTFKTKKEANEKFKSIVKEYIENKYTNKSLWVRSC